MQILQTHMAKECSRQLHFSRDVRGIPKKC